MDEIFMPTRPARAVFPGDALTRGDIPCAARQDGWTADRIRTFLQVLAETGTVSEAVRVSQMSRQSAYAFRNRADGRGFHLAWESALDLAGRTLQDEVMARAVHGCVELVVRDGHVVEERRRFDNRHSMAMLTHIRNRCAVRNGGEAEAVRIITQEFDEFVELVAEGGDPAEFLERRKPAWGLKELGLLERLKRFVTSGEGVPRPPRKRRPRRPEPQK